MLQEMPDEQRKSIVTQLITKTIFIIGMLVLGGTAALAFRGPSRPTVTEIINNPTAIERLAEAIVETDDRVDFFCAVQHVQYKPTGEVVYFRCYHPQPEVGPD